MFGQRYYLEKVHILSSFSFAVCHTAPCHSDKNYNLVNAITSSPVEGSKSSFCHWSHFFPLAVCHTVPCVNYAKHIWPSVSWVIKTPFLCQQKHPRVSGSAKNVKYKYFHHIGCYVNKSCGRMVLGWTSYPILSFAMPLFLFLEFWLAPIHGLELCWAKPGLVQTKPWW